MVTLENEQGFADDWKPSFGVVRGYLVLASDPGILARFDPKPSVTPHPLLLVRAGGWTDYLKPRKAKLAALLARQDGKPEATHLEELTRIGHLLELFDDLRLEWRTTKDTAVLQLRAKLNLSYAK